MFILTTITELAGGSKLVFTFNWITPGLLAESDWTCRALQSSQRWEGKLDWVFSSLGNHTGTSLEDLAGNSFRQTDCVLIDNFLCVSQSEWYHSPLSPAAPAVLPYWHIGQCGPPSLSSLPPSTTGPPPAPPRPTLHHANTGRENTAELDNTQLLSYSVTQLLSYSVTQLLSTGWEHFGIQSQRLIT